jgi:hypothetical protein
MTTSGIKSLSGNLTSKDRLLILEREGNRRLFHHARGASDAVFNPI